MAASGQERQRYALQTIFSFFLGLMVVAFVGVGVNTFYKSPQTRYEKQMQALSRQMEDLSAKPGVNATMTPADEAQLKRVTDEQRALQDKIDAETKVWARNTSIIVIAFATIAMALSLIRSEQLRVISNGLLLGGLFTMIYGTGWTIFAGDSTIRFLVMAFALAVTIGLGYAKFVRGKQAPAEVTAAAPSGAADVGDLERRVAALEERARAAAAALGGEREEHPAG